MCATSKLSEVKMYPKTTEHVLGTRKNGHNWCADSVVEQSGGPEMYNLTRLQTDVRIRCLDLIQRYMASPTAEVWFQHFGRRFRVYCNGKVI